MVVSLLCCLLVKVYLSVRLSAHEQGNEGKKGSDQRIQTEIQAGNTKTTLSLVPNTAMNVLSDSLRVWG